MEKMRPSPLSKLKEKEQLTFEVALFSMDSYSYAPWKGVSCLFYGGKLTGLSDEYFLSVPNIDTSLWVACDGTTCEVVQGIIGYGMSAWDFFNSVGTGEVE